MIPCAAHRPPHQKVRRKCVGKAQERCYCVNKSIRLQSARRSKRLPTHPPEGLQNPPWEVPKPPKIEVRAGPRSQNTPRPAVGPPRTPKKRLRCAQETPKRSQEAPRSAPKPAKRGPKGFRTSPKSRPKSPETHFQHNLCGKLCSKGSWSNFVTFFRVRAMLAMCKKPTKTS